MLCFVVLFSCQGLKCGHIIDKWHEPAESHMILLPISTGKTVILIPYWIYDNEDWCIKVLGETTKGDTTQRIFYINKTAFDTLKIGDFIYTDKYCNSDENNTKIKDEQN